MTLILFYFVFEMESLMVMLKSHTLKENTRKQRKLRIKNISIYAFYILQFTYFIAIVF